jgi:hypothetical protein
MCFVLFLFVTCFGCNFNPIAAVAAATAALGVFSKSFRLLENPVEATTIVQNFVLLLVENVV